jgi:hypothetical protein
MAIRKSESEDNLILDMRNRNGSASRNHLYYDLAN